METEVHTYGFSVAASVLLSFFPFLIVMVSLCRYLFQWPEAERAVYLALRDYFPDELGDFLIRNLTATVNSRGPFQFVSVLLLFFTANGVFEPLEVALNRIWGCGVNRSFVRNQVVSLGLIFACGTLALASTTLTALNQPFVRELVGPHTAMAAFVGTVLFKLAAIPLMILTIFIVYWLLPNCKVPADRIIPAAVAVGLLIELLKYVLLLAWPWLRLKLRHEYGPFINSVTIILWSFLAAMVFLAGAEWASRRPTGQEQATSAGSVVLR
jgi:uncharacterized BrkB/YihY/UPF0761 family membrane protein